MFVLLRDQAFFKTLFFSGDRPGDLSQVRHQKFSASRIIAVYYSTMFGGRLYVMVLRTFLPFVATRMPIYALLKQLTFT